MDIRIITLDRVTKSLIRDRKLCVTTITRIPGETCKVTKIFMAAPAKFAFAACPPQPRHPYALAGFKAAGIFSPVGNKPDDFVPRNERQFGFWQFTVHHVQVCPADSTRRDLNQNFICRWFWCWDFNGAKRLSGLLQNHRSHEVMEARMAAWSNEMWGAFFTPIGKDEKETGC